MGKYIYQYTDWPNFTWESEELINLLAEVRSLQGYLTGNMQALGFDLRNEANLETLTVDILKTSEIEGENLNSEQVRSSLARRLGMNTEGAVASDRDVDGIVEMMLDAVQNSADPITDDRLFGWLASLFPAGRSGMYKIDTGIYRTDKTGPMQVVSGAMGKEKIHFQAPAAEKLAAEMNRLTTWLNKETKIDPVLKAGIAHLWFLTLHPFDDGNGRIARALTDLLLTRADGTNQRYYSMSAQIRKQRKGYYLILEDTQSGDLDITKWLLWFLDCLLNALRAAQEILAKVLTKHKFWTKHGTLKLNRRQILLLNKLLDGFFGKLTSSKWAKVAKCSPDTALRDIQFLLDNDILEKEAAGGRSTSYVLAEIV